MHWSRWFLLKVSKKFLRGLKKWLFYFLPLFIIYFPYLCSDSRFFNTFIFLISNSFSFFSVSVSVLEFRKMYLCFLNLSDYNLRTTLILTVVPLALKLFLFIRIITDNNIRSLKVHRRCLERVQMTVFQKTSSFWFCT